MNHTFSASYHDLKLQNKKLEGGAGLQDSEMIKELLLKIYFSSQFYL